MPEVGAALEFLREQSGLSIDMEGRLCCRGDPITHARTLEVLWGSLSRRQDGRYLVQIGRESGYVRLEDAPYGVRGVTLERGWPALHLSDRSVEALDPATLTLDTEGVLHCLVKGGEHRARYTRSAQINLGLLLEEDPGAAGGFVLRLGGHAFRVGSE
ncbi:MAG: hypothetical protein A2V77_13915 [Anaeromyxobacter sp. RBG_16_69_14]|nr:MAG: hypothetical protein A2V77_13915 [Anaeromyxobacter sp. RBG_16_69_14]